MEFKEFEKLAKESVKGLGRYENYSDGDEFSIEESCIVQHYISGGAEGGNCWGGEARYYKSDTPPQEFIPLDRILETAKPDISYLEYKKLKNLLVEDSRVEREYYGNHTEYKTFSLNIRQLYDVLF